MFLLNKPKASQEARILKLLKNNRVYGVTNYELARCSLRYSARIYNLRKDGHNILTLQITRGTWKYYLLDEE
jgi:hypothetical protein